MIIDNIVAVSLTYPYLAEFRFDSRHTDEGRSHVIPTHHILEGHRTILNSVINRLQRFDLLVTHPVC